MDRPQGLSRVLPYALAVFLFNVHANAGRITGSGSGGSSGVSAATADADYLNTAGDSATGQINLTSATISAHLQVATVTVASSMTVNGVIASGSSITASHLDSQSANFTRSMTASTASVYGNAFSVGASTFVIAGSSIGVRTSNPRSALDVDGLVQIGFSATKSTISENGSVNLAANADLTVTGPTGFIFSQSTMTIGGKLSSANIAPLHVGCDEAPLNFANQAVAYFCGDDPSSSGLTFRNANGNTEAVIRVDTADVMFGAASNNNILIKTDASGSPPAHLVITTNGRFIFTKISDPAVVGITSGTFEIGGSEDYSFKVGASTVIVRGSGNVGIGDAEPNKKLHISSGTIKVIGTGSPTKASALCLTTAGTLTNCSSLVAADGTCTCTEP